MLDANAEIASIASRWASLPFPFPFFSPLCCPEEAWHTKQLLLCGDSSSAIPRALVAKKNARKLTKLNVEDDEVGMEWMREENAVDGGTARRGGIHTYDEQRTP